MVLGGPFRPCEPDRSAYRIAGDASRAARRPAPAAGRDAPAPALTRGAALTDAARVPPRNLVFCRVGEGSLHSAWIGDPARRGYDVWLDAYCDPARWAGAPAKVTDGRGTTKWPRVADLLAADPAAFERWDAVWFPDDDVAVDAPTVERFFALFHERRLALAQPALTDDSFWSHELTLACPSFSLRYTNFVEVMAPAFSRDALRTCAPTFGQSRSGWGLDFAWTRLLGDPRDAIAIVDATPMRHTRPVGRAGAYAPAEADAEVRALRERYGFSLPYAYRQYGGAKRRADGGPGAPVGAGLAFLAQLALGPPRSQRWRVRYWDLMRATTR